MICPVCGHEIKPGEFVVKRFLMVANAEGELKTARQEPDFQHADCHDPRSTYHK